MDGDGGDDIMTGGTGEDTMRGGTGVDAMSGGEDDDSMNGGAGGDIMCGDGETDGDYITDGDSNAEAQPDQIWAAVSDDTCLCGDNSTQIDNGCTDPLSSCSATHLTDKPAQCP
jgi:Ca2+-binding RTX toxin-like protein